MIRLHIVSPRMWGNLAAAWALIFALVSFYWAVGGRLGAETLGPGLVAMAQDPQFVLIGLWGAGAAKAIGAVLGLILTRGPTRGSLVTGLRRLVLFGGAAIALYGGASFGQHALQVASAIPTSPALGETAARWHLMLWDPWWVIGGVLFVQAARSSRHRQDAHLHRHR